ncbi:MAG TPA: succinate dehydrogenase, hydrophobic membrane anchor protein [Acidisphaera sp.]|nr:succinate dehydrogenase, hydrophobic membrane anchor protein [Acidisphaera sp.]
MSETGKSMSSPDAHVAVMRSQLGRVRGLGSARSGVSHWWSQRWTALVLVPLTLWFIWHVIALLGAPHQAVLDWMYSPLTVVLMLCLIVATFHHMQLGLQAVIEDYIHSEAMRFGLLLAVRAAAAFLALLAAVAVLKMGL